MASAEQLVLVGVSFRDTPVEARERCAVPQAALIARMQALRESAAATECLLLCTCNRTEVLLVAPDPQAAAAAVRAAHFDGVPGVFVHHGTEALFHIFRVAAGLESQVLGESQIAAQLREAAQQAQAAGASGAMLQRVIEHALAAGRRVRAETEIGSGTLSVARAAVNLAAKVSGVLSAARVLVIGCGETGQLVAQCLREHGTAALHLANRTVAAAEELAQTHGGSAHALEAVPELLERCDVVIVAVEAPQPVLRAAYFSGVNVSRRQRPMVVIDISVPRGAESALRELPDLFLADMDDIESMVSAHRAGRAEAADAAAKILVAEVEKFHGLRAVQDLKPQVLDLVRRFEQVRRELLEQHGARVPLERFSELLTQRLQEEALRTLKAGAREAAAAELRGPRYKDATPDP